ncbi:hypothetical protein Taro_043852 [Colocasia esculenta]|uniref:Uncharacterized protein n=1 Tax=Colocasia esculenta TaxID=4460 RepID=A0A843X4N4_COLES|nr:hypothetical protein [Colocasia esculenta]
MIPVDSQEGAVDSKQQTELRFAGLCVSVDSNQGPVDSYTQSQLSGFWIACACRQLWAGCRQEGAVDSKQQTELRFAGLCVSVDSNQGPVDSYTQSQLSGFWIACACRQLWAGYRQVAAELLEVLCKSVLKVLIFESMNQDISNNLQDGSTTTSQQQLQQEFEQEQDARRTSSSSSSNPLHSACNQEHLPKQDVIQRNGSSITVGKGAEGFELRRGSGFYSPVKFPCVKTPPMHSVVL